MKVTQNLVETPRVNLSIILETTNMPRRKIYIKDSIVDMKNKISKAKIDNRNLRRAHEDENNLLL